MGLMDFYKKKFSLYLKRHLFFSDIIYKYNINYLTREWRYMFFVYDNTYILICIKMNEGGRQQDNH